MTLQLLFWSISSHIYYETKTMGTNNGKVAENISNSYKYGEGERLIRYLKEDPYAIFSPLYYKTR